MPHSIRWSGITRFDVPLGFGWRLGAATWPSRRWIGVRADARRSPGMVELNLDAGRRYFALWAHRPVTIAAHGEG